MKSSFDQSLSKKKQLKGHGSHDDLYQETYSQGEQGITVKVKKVLYAPLFLVKKPLKETGAHLFANLFFLSSFLLECSMPTLQRGCQIK